MKKNKKRSTVAYENRSFLEYISENKKQTIVIGTAAAVLLILAIAIGITVGKKSQPASSGNEETAVTEQTETTVASTEVPLEENAYPQVNELIQDFYQAVTDGDVDRINSLAENFDAETLIYLQKRSAYIEEYRNVTCYTKAGPVDNSYVVYASYEVKFHDMETLVPGVSPYLVYAREDGSYYIHEGEVDDATNQYLEEISAQDDVVDLMNRVQVRFNEAVVENEELSNFLAKMKEDLSVEVGEALAEAQSAQSEADASAEGSGDLLTSDEVRATDVVNVRKSDSEQAERIGKVQIGEVLKLIESKQNGWSKVEYEGQEAYIKSEFLEAVGTEKEDDGDAAQQEDSGEAAPAQSDAADLPTSGTVMVADTINVREAASQTADKIGVCYQGEKLEILMQQADGWTKVKYKGKTGYVKTDVLKIVE